MAPPSAESDSNVLRAAAHTRLCNEFLAQDRDLEPIAVVGFAFKLPQGATNTEAFWQMLLDGRSAMTEVPKDRWNVDAFYHPDPERYDSMNSRGGHFLKESPALFDAPFFSVSPAEAACMDPQQRSLLECTYHALEHAGISTASIIGTRTSVFVGSFSREYDTVLSRDPQMEAKYSPTGTGAAMLANRLSWFYDLRGPSISLDTACSSSLNALHLAVQSIRAGESDMAIVAGCNLMLNPETNSIPLSNLGFLSRDGVCYSFDHRANGYARGEGTVVVIIKPLSTSLRANNAIRAVIRNTGSNQDGRTPGITQPSMEAQAALIRETYSAAGLKLQDTTFFEAHGTGTPVGDPREAGAIGMVFKDHRKDKLLVGAVKSNIGHLEGAAGLAGLIKTILALERGIIPRNTWFEKTNPEILADEWKIKFPVENMAWPRKGLRRASVNSFGYGGANAHVIVDDAGHYLENHNLIGLHYTVKSPPTIGFGSVIPNGIIKQNPEVDNLHAGPELEALRRLRVFVWSAADEGGLERLSKSYQEYLNRCDWSDTGIMDNLAFTLSNRRTHLPWRSYLVSESLESLKNCLSEGKMSKPVRTSSSSCPVLAFIFTGQGAQWYAMGKELILYGAFKNSLQNAEKYYRLLGCDWLLTEELNRSRESSRVDDPAYAQPMCSALQIALVDLLREWKICPTAVVGHSSGEIAAAYCAGAISRALAWRIAYHRGAVISKMVRANLRNGSMIAVSLSQTSIRPYLAETATSMGSDRLAIGCINSPKNVTLTGDEECVDQLKLMMDRDRIFARKLLVPVAYHSWHMEDVASEYRSLIIDSLVDHQDVSVKNTPRIFSSVSGTLITPDELRSPEYWVKNLTSQVDFFSALADLCTSLTSGLQGSSSMAAVRLIEIGPHGALRRPVSEVLSSKPAFEQVSYSSILTQDIPATDTVLELLGSLHCFGYSFDIPAANSSHVEQNTLQMLCDLPEYPFDHSRAYWLESRISQNYRFSVYPRHELLGRRTDDWNPLEAKWRNIIKLSELSWIKDHKFNGTELYPAAGILVMAIEAARQMSNPKRRISDYTLENVSFLSPLLVTLAVEGVETQFHLRPCEGRRTMSSECNVFNLYLFSSDDWTEICTGTITTNYEEQNDPLQPRVQIWPWNSDDFQAFFVRGVRNCSKELSSETLYKNLENFGFGFGPPFQSLKQVFFSDGREATATVDLLEWIGKVKNSHMVMDHVIHPTALDAVMQLGVVGYSKGTQDPVPTMVPTKIQRLWISNSLLSRNQSQHLKIYSKPTFLGHRDVEYSIFASDSAENTCQILLEGFRGTAISSLETSSATDDALATFCFDIDWKADVELLEKEELSTYCASTNSISPHQQDLTEKLELACLSYLFQGIEQDAAETLTASQSHLIRYIAWAKQRCDCYETSVHSPHVPDWKVSLEERGYFQDFLDQFDKGPEVDLVLQVGRNITPILRGDVDALQILHEESLQHFSDSAVFAPIYERAATYLDALAHKSPGLNILELGAGTGSCTAKILDALSMHGISESGQPRFGQYTYTDVSSRLFASAKARFNRYVQRMEFQVLDIGVDLVSQGFREAKYDLVLASMMLLPMNNIKEALFRIRQLLKPGGKLMLIEPCNQHSVLLPFIFGLMPRWWRGVEEHNRREPILSEDEWFHEMKETGFSDTEIIRDFPDQRHRLSVVVSTMQQESDTSLCFPQPLVVIPQGNAHFRKIAWQVQSQLPMRAQPACNIVAFHDLPSQVLENSFCICLLELDDPFFLDIKDEDWIRFKAMIYSASGLLWITCGRESRPEFGLVTGLARTIRLEYPAFIFIELALQQSYTVAGVAKHISKIFQNVSMSHPVEQVESEYLERKGILHIGRVVEANYMNDKIQASLASPKPELRSLRDMAASVVYLSIQTPGLLNTLHFYERETPKGLLSPSEVEVHVKAFGITFKDVAVALGQIPAETLGLECSGVVLRTGTCVSKVRPGDRVCCVTAGVNQNVVRINSAALCKIPDHMTFTTAAAYPVNFCIAYYSLVHLARLEEGESILIQSGAGGVGQASIQIAKILKADVYCTVGTIEKRDLLVDLYQLNPNKVIVINDGTFNPRLRTMMGGVDVLLNSLSGEGLRESLRCLNPGGRLIDISQSDKQSLQDIPGVVFAQNATYSKFDLNILLANSSQAVEDLLASVTKLLAEEKVRIPQPLRIYKSSDIGEAFGSVQSRKNTGKAVVSMQDDDRVSVMARSRPKYYFREDASYVIAGGLGGLGKSAAKWMADRNVRNLLLLSRSGAKGKANMVFLDELKAQGVTVTAPTCDITDEQALQSVLKSCEHSMPPIKGCIQGSMVLKDGLFEAMLAKDYRDVVRPKAQGSWNLHKHLPKDLDFFVLLASTSGIVGTRGQCNYASGNTFQDALARYRVSQGLKCISLDLGLMLSIGIAAKTSQVEDSRKLGYRGVNEAEFHAILEYCCDPALTIPASAQLKSQVMTGLEIPKKLVEMEAEDGMDWVSWARRPLLRNLARMDGLHDTSSSPQQSGNPASATDTDYKALFAHHKDSVASVVRCIVQDLTRKLAKLLWIPETDIDARRPLHAYGVDSLVAVEIRKWLATEVRTNLSIFQIMGNKSLAELAALIADKSAYLEEATGK